MLLWECRCKDVIPYGVFSSPLQNLERSEAQHKAEVDSIMEQLKDLRQKGDRDKEALKKAVRAQKERAEQSEEYAEQLSAQLAEKVPENTGGETSFQLMHLNL